jgi:type I restriction enzyme M protein
MPTRLTVLREKGKIWSHIRKKWLDETPEETVRQEYLCVLINEYGFGLGQVDEEREVIGRGSGHARADFVIWRTAKDKSEFLNPPIIVECKSDNVTIKPDDYGQGDNCSSKVLICRKVVAGWVTSVRKSPSSVMAPKD